MRKKIAIVGGGAAGLMAAIAATEVGADVTIYERMDRVGKKILATGNGRCNFTNLYAREENYHGENPAFVRGAMHRFWVEETIDFFRNLGVLCKVEERGKAYPYSGQASAILDVLRMELDRLGVEIVCGFEVESIRPQKGEWILKSYQKETARADAVILACGGRASPNLGSNGSGYEILKQLGHRITPVFPALVQVKTKTAQAKSLQGMKFDATVRLFAGKKQVFEEQGEILFTEYGLSGPPVFQLSRLAAEYRGAVVELDLMGAYTQEQVENLLNEQKNTQKTLENYLVGILPKRMGQVLLKSCGIAPLSRLAKSLTPAEIRTIAKTMKAWCFETDGTLSWNNAQVTAGGVDVNEVDAKTFASKLASGVYIVGELLDLDGDCGGYNLQWAWSSGYLAGKAAAEG